jgi:hypothetical protein
MRGSRAVWLVLSVALFACSTRHGWADPVAVRFPEGPTYGVVTLSSLAGEVLADGELIQTVRRRQVESRLVFRFKDGSLHDEATVFTQDRVFRIISYRMLERGRAFPHETEVALDRNTGRYKVRFRENPQAEEERHEGSVEMPADLYNGMGSTLARHLNGGRATGHILVFTPKPHLLTMELSPAGVDTYRIGGVGRTATRYLMKLEIKGALGVLATLTGNEPPPLHYWIANPVPGFLKFEGAMFLKGPAWRVEPSRVRWGP